jgi:hypothetical protein
MRARPLSHTAGAASLGGHAGGPLAFLWLSERTGYRHLYRVEVCNMTCHRRRISSL